MTASTVETPAEERLAAHRARLAPMLAHRVDLEAQQALARRNRREAFEAGEDTIAVARREQDLARDLAALEEDIAVGQRRVEAVETELRQAALVVEHDKARAVYASMCARVTSWQGKAATAPDRLKRDVLALLNSYISEVREGDRLAAAAETQRGRVVGLAQAVGSSAPGAAADPYEPLSQRMGPHQRPLFLTGRNGNVHGLLRLLDDLIDIR